MRTYAIGTLTVLIGALTACGGGSEVAVNFRAGDAPAVQTQALQQALSAEMAGTNGTLTIEDLRVIVSEVELEAVDGACQAAATAEVDGDGEAEVENEDCPGFEGGPYFIQVPLDGTEVQAVREPVPAGTYESLEFEIEDLSLDEEGEDEAALQQVAEAIVAAGFENWPAEASMFVAGTFLPAGATEAQPFELYVDAEVEIEMAFAEPLVVDGSQNADLTVDIDPAAWFTNADGSVMDLSQFAPGTLIELEQEVEDGFSSVEVEHEDAYGEVDGEAGAEADAGSETETD